jgi:nucleoside-diphosphate kinase
MEKTLLIVKPDGIQKRIIGEIISRFEKRNLRISAIRMLRVDTELAHRLYDIHKGKPFFDELVDFITSGDVVAMVIEGDNVISLVRKMIGATDPMQAEPGTIRGDYALEIGRNTVHASDSQERAAYEIGLFFKEVPKV